MRRLWRRLTAWFGPGPVMRQLCYVCNGRGCARCGGDGMVPTPAPKK